MGKTSAMTSGWDVALTAATVVTAFAAAYAAWQSRGAAADARRDAADARRERRAAILSDVHESLVVIQTETAAYGPYGESSYRNLERAVAKYPGGLAATAIVLVDLDPRSEVEASPENREEILMLIEAALDEVRDALTALTVEAAAEESHRPWWRRARSAVRRAWWRISGQRNRVEPL
jgi:hypothetical protein